MAVPTSSLPPSFSEAESTFKKPAIVYRGTPKTPRKRIRDEVKNPTPPSSKKPKLDILPTIPEDRPLSPTTTTTTTRWKHKSRIAPTSIVSPLPLRHNNPTPPRSSQIKRAYGKRTTPASSVLLPPTGENEDRLYYIKEIVDKKYAKLGKARYLVRWEGTGDEEEGEECTWEPEKHIFGKEMVEEFERRREGGNGE